MIRSTSKAWLVIAGALTVGLAAAQQIQVRIDGNPVYFADAEPQWSNGTVMVPARTVFEQMGGIVTWDGSTQTITTNLNGKDVVLQIGSTNAMIDGVPTVLDEAPFTVSDRALVPMRFLANALGAQVNWNASDDLVAIQTTTASIPMATDEVALHNLEVIPVSLDNSLSSAGNHVGDTFTMTVTSSDTDGYAGLPIGSKVEGHIASISPMTEDRPAYLDLAFDRVVLPNGQNFALDGSLISLDTTYAYEGKDGTYEAQGDAMAFPKMVFVGYGADSGMIVGVPTDAPIDENELFYIDSEVPPDMRTPMDLNLPAGTTFGIRVNHDDTITIY